MLLKPAEMLLPRAEAVPAWPCVACDQYTSQPEYWTRLEEETGEAPSTLHYVLPECFLAQSETRIPEIWRRMKADLANGVLQPLIPCGYVITERHTQSGVGLGLTGVIDLEDYDYRPGNQAPLRASEATVESRLPKRKAVRMGAPMETSHVLILLNDPARQVLEPLLEKREELPLLYDVNLSGNGGLLKGYAVTGEADIEALNSRWAAYCASLPEGMPQAVVGDGNHSLASAKSFWEELKPTLSEEAQKNHPARYAMVEMKNIHQETLLFAPIHRVLFGDGLSTLNDEFAGWLKERGATLRVGPGSAQSPDEQHLQSVREGQVTDLWIEKAPHPLAVGTLQLFLDDYLVRHPDTRIDYIHGDETLLSLSRGEAMGYLLPVPQKSPLFETVAREGVLPRKTFSMGEANEKRYYMECRKIVP